MDIIRAKACTRKQKKKKKKQSNINTRAGFEPVIPLFERMKTMCTLRECCHRGRRFLIDWRIKLEGNMYRHFGRTLGSQTSGSDRLCFPLHEADDGLHRCA
jgi:hypothetical protein